MFKQKKLWAALALVLVIVLTTVLTTVLSTVLFTVQTTVLPMSWRGLSQSEPDQVQKNTTNDPMIDNEIGGLQSLVQKNIAKETEGFPYSELPQLDEGVAEFKYKNVKRLMSTRIDTLDEYALEMVVQQIISQLPELVNLGLMHPFDATFAHTQTMSKQGHKFRGFEVEAIKQNYSDLYPFPINTGLLDLH